MVADGKAAVSAARDGEFDLLLLDLSLPGLDGLTVLARYDGEVRGCR